MSYDNMDHVGWVENHIAASKSVAKKAAADLRLAAEGKGWLAAPDKLNPFQCRAITILGIIGGGIYNAPINWRSVDWSRRDSLFVSWNHDLATVDFDALSVAVFLAHDAAIRLSVAPGAPRTVSLRFHRRAPHEDGAHWHHGHPTLAQAITRHRNRFPISHHVHWRSDPVEAAA